jgi:signal transduction histidine kinase
MSTKPVAGHASTPLDPKLKQKINITYTYIGVALSYLIVFTPLFLLYYDKYWIGALHAIDIAVILGLLWHVHRTRTVAIASAGLCAVAVLTIPLLTIDGGVDTSGIYFVLPATIFIFFLTDRKIGLRWVAAMFAPLAIALLLSATGTGKLVYTNLNFLLFLFSYLLSIALLFLYATEKDKLDRKLAASLREVHALAKNLKEEKASIERKVVERTREVKEGEARLEASINSLDVGFLMTDLQNNIVIINRAARRLLRGSAKAGARAMGFDEVTSLLEGAVDLPKIINNCLEDWHVVNIKEVDFRNRVLHIFAGPILISGADNTLSAIGCVVLVEDITEEAVAARSKDEFFSIASHELRTPLTSIRGNSSMMMDLYADVLKDESLREMIDDIHDSSTRLIDIVNDFLDVSRIEQGKINFRFEEVDLMKIVEKVADDMKASLKEKKLTLDINPKTRGQLPQVICDGDRIKQVIYNLVGNAIKFTAEGGVSVTMTTNDDMLKVSVSDTGRGVSTEGQKLLFHKFQQAGKSLLTRDTTKGTGLGLYISKLLVEGMGGSLILEQSVEGKGSTFSFIVPVATPKRLQKLHAATAKSAMIDSETGMTVVQGQSGAVSK